MHNASVGVGVTLELSVPRHADAEENPTTFITGIHVLQPPHTEARGEEEADVPVAELRRR